MASLRAWRAFRGSGWIAALLASVTVACAKGGQDTGVSKCEPGENIFCRCEGGEPGTRSCLPGGHGFDACVCGSTSLDDDGGGSAWPPDDDGGSNGAGASDGSGTAGGTSGGAGGSGAGIGNPGGASAAGGHGAASGTGGDDGPVDPGPVDPGPVGSLELLEPCAQPSACKSGYCIDGYCTRECSKVSECPWPQGECVPRQSTNICMPRCETAQSCSPYGTPESRCGFARAVDGWRVSVCASWDGAHQLMPAGQDCVPLSHKSCNLGYAGMGRVCSDQGVCADGCYLDGDCPSGQSCSTQAALGQCQAATPGP